MEKREHYRSFIISWIEPPLTSDRWTVNVASNDRRLFELMERTAKVIDGRTRDEAIASAKACIGDLLRRRAA